MSSTASKRSGKRIGIGARPPANPHAEAWIRQGSADDLQKGDLYTARLTLDIAPAMRARIRLAPSTKGVRVADLWRALRERNFPEKSPCPHHFRQHCRFHLPRRSAKPTACR